MLYTDGQFIVADSYKELEIAGKNLEKNSEMNIWLHQYTGSVIHFILIPLHVVEEIKKMVKAGLIIEIDSFIMRKTMIFGMYSKGIESSVVDAVRKELGQ